jgi:3',5'-cyclic AMP phosphodiesterase CpdA
LAARPILIAQISDLHLTRPRALAYGRVDTAAALLRTISTSGPGCHLRRHRRFRAAGRVRACNKAAWCSAGAIRGNSWQSRSPSTYPRNFSRSRLWNGRLCSHTLRRIDGLDILLIDSTVAGAPHGELDAPTLSWLDETLGALTTRPALLFLHHPPFDTGIAYTDAARLRNSDALAAVLGRHPLRTAGRGRTCSSFGPNCVRGHFGQYLPGGEQAVSLAFEPRWPEVFRICTRGFPDRDSEAWLLTSCR